MCLSTPGRVTQVRDSMAEVKIAGRTGWYNALARPEVQLDDFVLTYANMIVEVISEEEALCIQQTLREMEEALEHADLEEFGEGAPVSAALAERAGLSRSAARPGAKKTDMHTAFGTRSGRSAPRSQSGEQS
jgi:hydrogenase assembly chaperone HypC/HupF